MNKYCSECKHSDRRVKQIDNDNYCSVCEERYICLKCDRIYDSCMHCHKTVVIVLYIKSNMIMWIFELLYTMF